MNLYRIFFLLIICITPNLLAGKDQIVIGSKAFTEGVILGHVLAQTVETSGVKAEHKSQMGGTAILWEALKSGSIDAYVEYTGTIAEEIFSQKQLKTFDQMKAALKEEGISITSPLGFNNTYALGMKAEIAQKLGIKKISDLNQYPDLSIGFSSEFMSRADGWPALKNKYNLPQSPKGLDHDLAYRALDSGSIAVTDLYSTDAEIELYDLVILEDDLEHFPKYDAVILYRSELAEQHPEVIKSFNALVGTIDEKLMANLNAATKIKGTPENQVAASFVGQIFKTNILSSHDSWLKTLATRTGQHLKLTGISLLLAIIIAVPLGVVAYIKPRFGHFILGVVGTIQTIPSLALLVVLIPLLGIGEMPAITALFMYSLLPIVRNTTTGLQDIPTPIKESAIALGLTTRQQLQLIYLPLSASSIMAGIKTSAVINVGTATLGALIGAGGLGETILSGVRLANTSLILQGAIPAAVLALLIQGFFDFIERSVVPRGLRLQEQTRR